MYLLIYCMIINKRTRPCYWSYVYMCIGLVHKCRQISHSQMNQNWIFWLFSWMASTCKISKFIIKTCCWKLRCSIHGHLCNYICTCISTVSGMYPYFIQIDFKRCVPLYAGCLSHTVPFSRLVQHIPFGLPRESPDTPVCSYPRDPDHCAQRLQPPLMPSVHWRPAVVAVHRFPVGREKNQVV